MKENYYTLEEISLKIKTPVAYLRKMIKQERLIAHCMGRSYKVTETDLQRYIDSCGVRHVR